MMRVRLMDGDRIVVERGLSADPGPSSIAIPVMSKDGRCVCTRPAVKIGMFCRQVFRRAEVTEDGVRVYRIGARAAARLVVPIKPWLIA